jgi:hypothetical protein
MWPRSRPGGRRRRGDFDGVAFVFWDDDARNLSEAPERSCFTVVADSISFRAGADWNV